MAGASARRLGRALAAGAEYLRLELGELVAHLRRLLEFEVPGMIQHELLEPLDLLGDLLLAHGLIAGMLLRRLQLGLDVAGVVDAVDDVLDALDHAARRNAIGLVEGNLLGAAALGLADGL